MTATGNPLVSAMAGMGQTGRPMLARFLNIPENEWLWAVSLLSVVLTLALPFVTFGVATFQYRRHRLPGRWLHTAATSALAATLLFALVLVVGVLFFDWRM